MRKAALAIFLVCMAAGPALPEVSASTRYQPFAVSGKTARAIYLSVLRHSRKKGGFNTYATTDVSLRPRLKLVSKPACKVTEASFSARFVVHLPKLAHEAALSPGLRADWQSFVGALKKHEEHHRDIWLSCAADLANAATGTPEGDCASFAQRFKARIKAQDRACRARNEAFDAEAQGQLPALPFIRRVLAAN